ncbi:hypothetical protein ACQEVF_57130 [Nonomuraea polychroma]|uniref:hypothetical protein n=1 Tax=Nonomuraea polychroma TaxID=46176 RepID=UPI003D8FC379
MSKDKPARWRQLYTGEPYTAALEWYRRNGLYNGLVPDAEDPRQQRLEAAVLAALARPSAMPAPPRLRKPLLALAGATPDVDALTLRPASQHLPHLLASLLPARTAHGVSGVPGLRARLSRRTGQLTLGRIHDDAVIGIRATQQEAEAALRQAKDLVKEASLEPLWDSDHMTGAIVKTCGSSFFKQLSTYPRSSVIPRAARRACP